MANTSPYSVIYAFGDSLSDAGNVSIATSLIGTEPVSPPYATENYGSTSASVFSNGPTWVQDLSVALGIGTLAPSLKGGTDFAYGGAETGGTPQNSGNLTTTAISVPTQLSQFSSAVSKPSATALYTISIGSNDILDVLSNTALNASQQATDVTDAVNNEISDIRSLIGDGAKTLVVFNVPNLGLTPEVLDGLANGSKTPSAALTSLATGLSAQYDSQLATGLATLAAANTTVTIHTLDSSTLLGAAVANPAGFGLSNATTPVWSGNFTSAGSGTLSSTSLVTQDQSVFFDHLHPTASVHNIIGNVAETEVSPSVVYQVDTVTGTPSFTLASAYLGTDTDLHTQFAAIGTDSVALFASTAGTFLQSGAANDILVGSSGNNMLSAGGGSNFLVGGTGTDTFSVDGTGSASTWNAILNFHAGDLLEVAGYKPGTSNISWTDTNGQAGGGATLHIDTTGTGAVYASDTFIGVPLATAQAYTTSSTANSFTVRGV